MKFDWRQSLESMSVAIVLLLVLLPVRVLFVRYLSNDWLGSFGVITTISVLIIYLARKNKLGWFGRAFHRQMFRIHHGKRRYFVYTQLVLGTIFFSLTIHAINLGDQLYEEEKSDLLTELDIKSIEDFIEKSGKEEVTPEIFAKALFVLIYIIIFRFDVFAIMISSINDVFDGYVLHFSTVFLVEEIELIGIAILTRFLIRSEKSTIE